MAEELPEKMGDKVADKVAEKTPDKVADKVADRVADQMADKVADKVANQMADQIANKMAAQASEKGTEKRSETGAKETGKSMGNVADKIADKVANKVADKVADRVADKVADRMSSQMAGQMSDEVAAKVADKMARADKPEKAATAKADKDHPRKEHHWGTWILILLVVILGIGAFFLFGEKKAPKPPLPPVAITVTPVQKGDIAVAVSSLGSVQPVYTASMSPRVDGQVVSVNYTEGQMVASNDLLAVIDPGPYEAALTQAQGQLERDTNLLAGAEIDLERYRQAVAKKAVPQQQVDDQLALVHQDEGTVKLDEGTVENARVQLAYAYIRAPFAGRVGLRQVDPGNIVHAANSNAMVVVAQLQPITVVFNVAEDYLPQIQEQMQAGHPSGASSIGDDSDPEYQQPVKTSHQMTVEAWDRADENKIATGKVLALDNMIDTATGTVRLKAIFENTNLTLFPNQFVNAKLIIKILHGVELVPTYAIQQNPEGSFVYLVTHTPPTNSAATNAPAKGEATTTTNEAGTNFAWVTMRAIVPGTADGNTTAVTGLAPGDLVAVDNFSKLGEGVKVTPRQDGAENQHGKGKRSAGSYGKKPADASESDAKESP